MKQKPSLHHPARKPTYCTCSQAPCKTQQQHYITQQTSQTSLMTSVSIIDASTSLVAGNRYSGRSILNHSHCLHIHQYTTLHYVIMISLQHSHYLVTNSHHNVIKPNNEIKGYLVRKFKTSLAAVISASL